MKRIIKFVISILLLILSLMLFFKIYYNSKTESYNTKYKKIVDEVKNNNSKDSSSKVIEKLNTSFENDDIKGTIKIGNNLIDTLFVQSFDNNYYLRRSLDKRYNVNGTVFVDYRNNENSKKIIIYGHSYRYSDKGFSKLFNYKDKSFYENNKYITLNYNGIESKYEIFSTMIIKYEDEISMFYVFKYLHDFYNFNPSIVNIDFSMSLKNVLNKNEIFGNKPKESNCFFHFFSSNLKKIKSLKLPND